MKERGIAFSAEMVPRVLDGSKTQSRRVMTPQPVVDGGGDIPADAYCDLYRDGKANDCWTFWTADNRMMNNVQGAIKNTCHWRCRHGVPGDELWIREAWCVGLPALPTGEGLRPVLGTLPIRPDIEGKGMKCAYKASWDGPDQPPWRSGRFMPKWAARPARLPLLRVRVERVQDISEEDARAEGMIRVIHEAEFTGMSVTTEGIRAMGTVKRETTRRQAFAEVWDKLNGKRAPWASNPWAWVLEWSPMKP